MLNIKRFDNDLMSANCYILFDKERNNDCIIIDPGSEECVELIEYFKQEKLEPEYIILTHEHTDHTWGCNTLIDRYNAKVICTQACKEALPKEGNSYFQLYYDDPDYTYSVKCVDYTTEQLNWKLDWNGHIIRFIATPGHSDGSMCFSIDNDALFTGDTIMQYKPYIPKKRGSLEKYKESVEKITTGYIDDIMVYPGHGVPFLLSNFKIL